MNAFDRLRQAAADALRELGATEGMPLKSIILVPREGEPVTIPVFHVEMDDTERAIVETIRAAGESLQQREIAERGDLGLRTVQQWTAQMVKRGILLRHPGHGFYLPGMAPGGTTSEER